MPRRILCVEDDQDLRGLITAVLQPAGFEVECASDGEAGMTAFNARTPDLVLLDVGLGEMDGFEVCRQLRAKSNTPIVFMTARGDEIDELIAFASGADDYITKPFSERVLLARVSSAIRRANSGPEVSDKRIVIGPLVVDLAMHSASIDGNDLDLTKLEFSLLAALAEHPKQVISRKALMERVWGDWFGDTHVLYVHMSRLRLKVKAASGVELGIPVRGVGYRLGLAS